MSHPSGPSPPPPPPPPPPAPPFPPGRGPRQRWIVWPWVVGGLALLVLVIAGVIAMAQRDDDGSTVADADRDTTTSESPSTTTTSEPPSTTDTDAIVFAEDLQLGDCFNDSAFNTANMGEISRAECGSPHDAEVFALVTLPGEPDAPYPGDDEVFRLSDELCLGGFASYVGIDYLDSMWEVGYYTPIEASWQKYDDRLVVCYLADPHFNKMEGSKRETRT